MGKAALRNFVATRGIASAVVIGLIAPAISAAQETPYPERPIRFLVPFPPGGSTDIISRLVGQKLTEKFPQPVVVENRSGGAGIIAAEAVARAPADGYMMLLGNTGILAINPNLYRKLPYDPIKDFAAVTLMARVPNVLVVHPSLPVKSVRELVQLAKKDARPLNYGSPGSGSLQHLAMEMFKTAAGVNFTHVPYKGGGPALIDLIGGHLEALVATLPSALPHIQAGRLRVLAIGDAQRSALMPELPTIAESGYPGYEAYSWHGVMVPQRTPADIVSLLNREIVAILSSADSRAVLKKGGFDVVASSSAAFAEMIKSEIAKYAVAVKSSGARVD
ncbi:MAG: tripartite tricarboxylate transporter substrate binding protein [Betaproteobacteria bacterium]|nr:tripartite tricarboxylate transporter substrate binding protein [Betaproteobacteria bacterium]